MESYIHYITTIAAETGPMRPVHGIVPFTPLEESIAPISRDFSVMVRSRR